MLEVIFGLHIAGTVVFFAYAVTALGSLVLGRGDAALMRRAAVVIGGHQAVTGLALGVLSPNMTMLAVCVRGIVLVAILWVLSYGVSRRLAYAQSRS